MALYKISAKSSYIDIVVDFIKKKYAKDLDLLIVILPNGYICSYVQKYIVQNYGASILPQIITLNEIGNTSLIDRFDSKNIFEMISHMQEKMTLSEIIYDYQKVNYNIVNSINTANLLANLFYEFELNNITNANLDKIKNLHNSHHWNEIYDFISFVYNHWQQKLQHINKLSKASCIIRNLETAVDSIKQKQHIKILLAGFTGNNQTVFKFIKSLYHEKNVDYILPPTGEINLDKIDKIKSHDGLYNIHRLLKYLKMDLRNFEEISSINAHCKINFEQHKYLDAILLKDDSNDHSDKTLNDNKQKFEYVEFENIFEESEYIANQCAKICNDTNKMKASKIAIVINNAKCKEHYVNFLNKYLLPYRDLIGTEFCKSNLVSLIYSISSILCNSFNIHDFLNIIDHPQIISNITIELKCALLQHKKILSSIDDIEKVINNSASLECREYFLKLKGILSKNVNLKTKTFHNILKIVFDVMMCLNLRIFSNKNQEEQKIWDIFDELLSLKWSLHVSDIKDFPEILLNIVREVKTYNQDTWSNIILARDQDISLINFDYIFLTNFSDGNSPTNEMHHPFLSRIMQDEIGLNLSTQNISNAWYNFYLNLQNPHVIMTMSKKQEGKSITKTSPFLLKLEHIIGDLLKKKTCKITYDDNAIVEGCNINPNFSNIISDIIPEKGKINNLPCIIKDKVSFSKFPDSVSVSDIETLIKAPYNFYAKKILKLRPWNNLDDIPDLSVFGNIFHKIAEKYTNSYDNIYRDKEFVYDEIMEQILTEESFPEQSLNIWRAKLLSIRDEFINFDHSRRQNATKIHTEREGSIMLDIGNHKLKIKAIADRIEVNKKTGVAYILDYKTGVVPTKVSIESGMSPQLIIEALIMMEDGFNLGFRSIPKLVYVKIGSSTPYIRANEIAITKEELERHKQGLHSLLEYYIEGKTISIMPNMMQYDDYAHLARRL